MMKKTKNLKKRNNKKKKMDKLRQQKRRSSSLNQLTRKKSKIKINQNSKLIKKIKTKTKDNNQRRERKEKEMQDSFLIKARRKKIQKAQRHLHPMKKSWKITRSKPTKQLKRMNMAAKKNLKTKN